MRNTRPTIVTTITTAALLMLTGCLAVPSEKDGQEASDTSAASPDVTCPTEAAGAPEEEIPQNIVEELVGFTEDAAATCARELGWGLRVVRRDEDEFQVTMDYRPDRVNITIDAGIVTSARVG